MTSWLKNQNFSHRCVTICIFLIMVLRASGAQLQTVAEKKGLLLHCAGIEVQKLFKTLQDPGAAEGESHHADEYQIALRTLDNYFSRQLKEPYEGHIFRSLKQEEGETVDQYVHYPITKASRKL